MSFVPLLSTVADKLPTLYYHYYIDIVVKLENNINYLFNRRLGFDANTNLNAAYSN